LVGEFNLPAQITSEHNTYLASLLLQCHKLDYFFRWFLFIIENKT